MSRNTSEKITPMSVNKTKIFFSGIEGRHTLVRTGTLDDNSLYHSILHATSKKYVSSTEKTRKKICKKFMKLISKNNSRDISEIFLKILENIYQDNFEGVTEKRIKNKLLCTPESQQTYKVLFELLTIQDFKNNIVNPGCDKKSILENQAKILKEKLKSVGLDKKRQEGCIKKFDDLSESIIDNISESDMTEINSQTLKLISKKIDRDIYFIDSVTRFPFSLEGKTPLTENNEKMSVILLRIGNKYEVIGRLLKDNRIQREFYSDDEMIKRIRSYLLDPENTGSVIPNIASYISESESSSESDSEEDSSEESDSD